VTTPQAVPLRRARRLSRLARSTGRGPADGERSLRRRGPPVGAGRPVARDPCGGRQTHRYPAARSRGQQRRAAGRQPGGSTVRTWKRALPVLALVAVAAGCSSSDDVDEQRLAEKRETYCTQLGMWQKARNTADPDTPNPSGFDEVGAFAQDAFLAMRPLKDETVDGGRSLGEATVAAMTNGDLEAEGRIRKYCDNAGFETLTR
jgi:hypothetical protein